MKNKTCLIILPTSHGQEISSTLRLSILIEIIKEFEKGGLSFKLATYRGNKPYLNFENDEKNRNWAIKNEDILLNVLNIDNISVSKYDGLFIPNYIYIYEELKLKDHNLTKLISQFHNANKAIATIGHSLYAYI
jgi:putative intracellular protease/amidase